MTAVERKASLYQVNPVSRLTAEFIRPWGPGFDEEGAGKGGGGETGGAAQSVRGN